MLSLENIQQRITDSMWAAGEIKQGNMLPTLFYKDGGSLIPKPKVLLKKVQTSILWEHRRENPEQNFKQIKFNTVLKNNISLWCVLYPWILGQFNCWKRLWYSPLC